MGKNNPHLFFEKILYYFAKVREIGVILALVVLMVLFSLSVTNFLTWGYMTTILSYATRIGLIGAGATLLMASREIDLSVGSVFAIVPVTAFVLAEMGLNVWLCVAVSLPIGVLCGILNGAIVLKLNLPSFIATLGTMFLFRSIALILSVGGAKPAPSDPTYRFIFGGGNVFGLNTAFFWWCIIFAITAIVLHKTKFGNWTLAVGGNMEAARSMGVKVERVKMINFIVTSFLAGLCGLLYATSTGTIYAVYGQGMEFQVITAIVLGGTPLSGGAGTALGTVLGSVLLGIVYLGTVSIRWFGGLPIPSAYVFDGVVGILVVVGMFINMFLEKLRRQVQGC
jgi:ribose/xylose/arabinose/galactoside ABC-type transport system permease subunit